MNRKEMSRINELITRVGDEGLNHQKKNLEKLIKLTSKYFYKK